MANICFVHNVGVVGGAEKVSQMIMKELTGNHQFFLACPEDGELTKACEALSCKTTTHNIHQPDYLKPLKTYKSYKQWQNIIDQFNLDIFHTGDLLSTRSLMSAAKNKGIKVVNHVHFPFSREFAEWVFKSRPHPNAFIFCSQELQNTLGEMLKELCPNTAQHVVHNGVDTAKFSPVENHIAKNKKPTETIKRIGIVANLQERKGHDDFINMAHILTTQGYNLAFDVIGGDIMQTPREQYLKNKCHELQLSERFHFHGQVNNVKEYLDTIDIYICASHEEAFPISILEAMSYQMPIVSTNVNGIPEAIETDKSGLLVNAKSPELLAEKVAYLIENPTIALELGKNARNRVLENFSIERFANKINHVYKKLN